MLKVATLTLAFVACAPETTSFRSTDQGDPAEPTGAAYYQLHLAGSAAANVHVWSNGGYIGSSDEPMTHIGFEIRNTGGRPVVFDADGLGLALLDHHGAALPAAAFVAVTPLGPSRITIQPGADALLDSYFQLRVRPRVVDAMRVHWTLRVGSDATEQTTSFVRDDDGPVLDYPPDPVRAPS